jgi:alanine racemase
MVMHYKGDAVKVDPGAIERNCATLAGRLEGGAALCAVVKADGYGHGAVAVSREALKAGAKSLGVLTALEGEALRKDGIKAPIHLLSPLLPEQAREAIKLKLVPTICSAEQVDALPAGTAVHVDLDFGLGRWGVLPKDLPDFLRRARKLKLAGLSTHIDYVPGKNTIEAEEKLGAFARIAAKLKKTHKNLLVHAANSSILMDFPHWQFDMARVGNLLYGINAAKSKSAPLKMPFRFYGRIISLRRALKGRSIGYASEYLAPRTMTVATLPVGYSDGLTLEPAERLIGFGITGKNFWGMIGEIQAPFVGRCGIAHCLIDVTDAPDVKIGDPVRLPIRRTACSKNVPRIYV